MALKSSKAVTDWRVEACVAWQLLSGELENKMKLLPLCAMTAFEALNLPVLTEQDINVKVDLFVTLEKSRWLTVQAHSMTCP